MGIADLTASVFKKKWRSSETIHLGRSDSQGAKMIDRKAVKPRWQVFWRKINREKKKIFSAPTTTTTNFHASYEPDDYFQNFDPGTGWTEPDNLPRSFSARFADPSRILQKSATVGHESAQIRALETTKSSDAFPTFPSSVTLVASNSKFSS